MLITGRIRKGDGGSSLQELARSGSLFSGLLAIFQRLEQMLKAVSVCGVEGSLCVCVFFWRTLFTAVLVHSRAPQPPSVFIRRVDMDAGSDPLGSA